MSHPIGKYINKSQKHELNYWLKTNSFSETEENRTLLHQLIDDAKQFHKIKDNDHLTHDQLNTFFVNNKKSYDFKSK